MDLMQEPIIELGTCKRCGRKTRILSNGLCSRCDNVLYGHQPQKDNSPWYPKQIPIVPYPEPPERRQYWCRQE